MIDLHLHTTASDGRSSPEDLVPRRGRAGLRTIAVTDHDTVAALDRGGGRLRRARASSCVPGIEITADVGDEVDVHVLGYFLDHRLAGLAAFLEAQRRRPRAAACAR